MRILIVAHGHPSLHKGGGEIAAYSLFKMLRSAGEEAVFLGWGGAEKSTTGGFIAKHAEHDYMLYSAAEYFAFSASSENSRKALELLTRRYDFNVVHFHHYIHVGIEAAAVMKSIKPAVRVVMTLHEYLGICANNGQLFKKSGVVCENPEPKACVQCFPQRSETDFFMRKLRIQAAFSFIDQFISPSEFLREKYIDWGINREKIVANENPLLVNSESTVRVLKPPSGKESWKLGFFGQINFYKGLDIILNAVELALKQGVALELHVHGKLSAVTGEAYIKDLEEKMRSLSPAVTFHGPYDQTEILDLMSRCHFVVMGSRWYENSPVVIQEALIACRPLIFPKHGGMQEKIGAYGIAYRPGNSGSIVDVLNTLGSFDFQKISQQLAKKRLALTASTHKDLFKVRKLYADI